MVRSRKLSRRDFVTAVASGAPLLLPAAVSGQKRSTPPSEKLNIAFIGIGGGYGNYPLEGLKNDHNVVALCDVDWRTKEQWGPMGAAYDPPIEVAARFPGVPRFDDWRRMLEEKDKGIDAVVVCTPDHTHAKAAITAMKMGKHVFCEKPLAHSIDEVRAMMAAARKYKVSTQTGVQAHASEDLRSIVEWVQDGAIGDVKEVHVFEGARRMMPRAGAPDRPRPRSPYDDIAHVNDEIPVPPEVKWDLWLGPAPARPYNPMYLPTRWRSWLDFGTGVLGDHGPHYIDVAVWSLGLEFPETIEASTDPEYDPQKNTQTFPRMATVRYTFPARGKKPPVVMTWHAGNAPSLPSYVKEDQLPGGGGMLVGTRGAIVFGSIYRGKPGEIVPGLVKLLPEELDRSYKRPAKTLARPQSNWLEWTECAKSGKQPSANFQYGGLLTQIALLGDIAIRNKGTLLRFDRKSGKFTNSDEANRAFGRLSRPGWELPG